MGGNILVHVPAGDMDVGLTQVPPPDQGHWVWETTPLEQMCVPESSNAAAEGPKELGTLGEKPHI